MKTRRGGEEKREGEKGGGQGRGAGKGQGEEEKEGLPHRQRTPERSEQQLPGAQLPGGRCGWEEGEVVLLTKWLPSLWEPAPSPGWCPLNPPSL